MASLWVISGSRAGESVGVTGELVIGRENADLTIDDAEVSRRHVAVRLEGGQLEVEDLGSANGTFVEREPHRRPRQGRRRREDPRRADRV